MSPFRMLIVSVSKTRAEVQKFKEKSCNMHFSIVAISQMQQNFLALFALHNSFVFALRRNAYGVSSLYL